MMLASPGRGAEDAGEVWGAGGHQCSQGPQHEDVQDQRRGEPVP